MWLVFWLKNGAAALAWTVVVAVLAVGATAQQYRSDPVDDKARLNHRLAAQSALRSPAEYTANKARFDEFFQKYYFPAMTRSSPDALGELGKLRYDLFNQYLWKTSNEQLQSDLTKMAFEPMLKLLRPAAAADMPYHPAVQYNAVLVLGLLDEQYAIESGSNARPPKPYPAATKVLIAIVDRATTDQFPPPVILGALIGLERHARYRDALDAGAADAMTAALLKLAERSEPIQDMDLAAYAWLRLRAASALAELGSLGPNNRVHNALIQMVGDFRSLDDRCDAAALLDKLKYENAKIDANPAIKQLFTLARNLGEAEGKRAQEYDDIRFGGGGFASPRGERFGPSDAGGEQDLYPRRQVHARLVDLRRGLRAVKPAVPEESQKQFDAVLAAIKPAIDSLADKETLTLRLTQVVRRMAPAIDEAAALPEDEPAAEESAAEAAAEAPAEESPAAAEVPGAAVDGAESN